MAAIAEVNKDEDAFDLVRNSYFVQVLHIVSAHSFTSKVFVGDLLS